MFVIWRYIIVCQHMILWLSAENINMFVNRRYQYDSQQKINPSFCVLVNKSPCKLMVGREYPDIHSHKSARGSSAVSRRPQGDPLHPSCHQEVML